MKKWLFATAVVCTLAQPALAQKFKGDILLTLQGGMGVAIGTFSQNYGVSPQLGLQFDYAVADGTAMGLRAGYQQFKTDDGSVLGNVMVSQFNLQGKQFFTPENRAGMYAVAGWGVYWWKDDSIHTLSNAEWGGFGGLGLHYEASDRVSFTGEVTYNGFFADPTGISYFSFTIGAVIGLREE
jgi:hypothetical protein